MHANGLTELFSGKLKADEFLCDNPIGILSMVRYATERGQALTPSMLSSMEEAGKRRVPFRVEKAREELDKILLSDAPQNLIFLQNTDTLRLFLPELAACFEVLQNNPYHSYGVGEHILNTVRNVPPLLELRWAALLHDTGKSRTHTTDMFGIDHFHGHEKSSLRIAQSVLDRYQFSQKEKEIILLLIEYHDVSISKEDVSKWIEKIGLENFLMLLQLKEGDGAAKRKDLYEKEHQELMCLKEIAENIKKRMKI